MAENFEDRDESRAEKLSEALDEHAETAAEAAVEQRDEAEQPSDQGVPENVDDQGEAREQVAEADPEQREDVVVRDEAPEVSVYDHLLEQDREARLADPTVDALRQVEEAMIARAEEENAGPMDESVAAMIDMQTRDNPSAVSDYDGALEKGRELGAQADVQQQLMQSQGNYEQPLAQRPVELVDPLEDGAGVGTLKDTSDFGDQPGTVIREQRRPGAPLTEEQADIATFPSGPKDRDEAEDEERFEPWDGEGPVTAREGVDPVLDEDLSDQEEDE